MKLNNTISSILRAQWLIDKSYAESQLPFVLSLIKNPTSHTAVETKDEDDLPVLIVASTGGSCSVPNFYKVGPSTDLSFLPKESIAVCDIHGALLKNDGLCSYGMRSMAAMINNLAAIDGVKGIVLDIDSPGGEASGTSILSDAIKAASARKPVIAHINDGMAASAAMWIASSATEIYASQTTDKFGSIGVYTSIADWKSHYKEFYKLDVKDIYAPQSTDKNKDYNDALNGDEAGIQSHLSTLADKFISVIENNRAGKLKSDSWKTGKMFFAPDAHKIGLIDGIKTTVQVYKRMSALTSSSQKSNTMAFEKTLATAKATSFEVVDGGFLVTEENLNHLETALVEAETSAANLTAANETIQQLEANAQTATDTIATLREQLAAANSEIDLLKDKPSGSGTTLLTTGDQSADGKKTPSYLSDDSPINQFADKKVFKK